MTYSAAHLIDELLVNKILTYRPSHPSKALIIGMYDEIKKCEIYKHDIGGFEEDKEITLYSGEFVGWYLKTLKDNEAYIDHFEFFLKETLEDWRTAL
jgi:hypothetical protein